MLRAAMLAVAMAALVGLPAWAAPPSWTLNLLYEEAEGSVVVNGVTVHRFPRRFADGSTTSTSFFSISEWLVNGANRIEIRIARLGKDGWVESLLAKSREDLEKPRERRVQTGVVTLTETAAEVPAWSWLTAAPGGNDEAGLRAAVAGLHAALQRKDLKALDQLRAPLERDFEALWGKLSERERGALHRQLETGRVEPLPEPLGIASAFDGRLAVVSGPDGQAPIRVELGRDNPLPDETGQYWAKLDGQWKLVR
ncbi:MAG: hypothetical protein FJX68_09400 [Alphaproteobacteria bacterium]|nr:hypothetical protein [Alphaproteobacteria bacterium]